MTVSKTCKPWVKVFALPIILSILVLAAAPPQARGQAAPRYKVDPSWPKELPNNWIMWNSTGLVVDKDDHIWVQHHPRQAAAQDAGAAFTPPTAECCIPAPTYVQFDAQGNVLKSWGGPDFVPNWPILEHGLFIDKAGNFWFGGNFRGTAADLLAAIPPPKELLADRHVFKFSPDHKQLLMIGHPSNAPINNQDTSLLGAPSEMFVDDDAHEVYIADGYRNARIVVYDSNTGAFKRGWGAYGMPLSEIGNGLSPTKHDPAVPSKQFGGIVTSVEISNDGLVYVGDRAGDRIQIFTKEGKFVKEFIVHPNTLGQGSVWSTMFSRDPQQKFLYVSDGMNGKIWILNRDDGKEVGSIGHKGHQAGQFGMVECMAMDSKGNLYDTEVGGASSRIQKFVPLK